MTDRWNPKLVTRPKERKLKIFVPGGDAPAPASELNSQHRVTDHPAGFRIRERGALDGTVVHSYRCPVHGVFDAAVPRSDVPDLLPCPQAAIGPISGAALCNGIWCGSFAGQGHAAGEVMS